MSTEELLAALRQFEALEEVPEEQLRWLIDKGEVRDIPKGQFLFQKGDPLDHMHFIVEGRLAFRVEQKGNYREVGQLGVNSVTGTLPYSRAKNATGDGVSAQDLRLLSIHRSFFHEMICEKHELTRALVHTMITRVRDFTKSAQQNEKMLALGKLSAGLAHELNNPSAAVVRSSQALRKILGAEPEKFKKVMLMEISPEQVDTITGIIFECLGAGLNDKMSLMAKTELEDDVADWLEDNGFDDGYELAGTFADFALGTDHLDAIKAVLPGNELIGTLIWIEGVLMTEKLVMEIESASTRINDLVRSIKTYSHMDQAPDKQQTAIEPGIRSTLRMLNHKLKLKKIEVRLDIPEDLPQIMAFPGELNQLWTNLLDNAIDAMPTDGKLEISAEIDRDFVLVHITDNGPGIPEDIQSQIFDPFFTTKAFGEGTGLGLDIVQKIVRQHNGDISFTSKPGQTKFTFCCPING